MNEQTLDTATTKQMVEAFVIQGASIIGQPGGWKVMLKLETIERPLGTQRGTDPRLWRSLDRCVDYLRNELKICQIDRLDSTNYSLVKENKRRSDTAERMRKAHQAIEHDQWFRQQVQQGLQDADDPNTQWVTHEKVRDHFASSCFLSSQGK